MTAGNSELLTLAILPPKQGASTPSSTEGIIYKDCVVTAFSWSGDMTDDGGLVKYSATLKTYSPVALEQDVDSVTVAAYSMNSAQTLSMGDWAASANRMICGQAHLMLNSFTFNIENDAVFLGRGSSGVCEAVSRGGAVSYTHLTLPTSDLV